VTLTRRYYLCLSCHTGFFPKDLTLGIDGASVTPGSSAWSGSSGRSSPSRKGARS
jgi:hypothetical protein